MLSCETPSATIVTTAGLTDFTMSTTERSSVAGAGVASFAGAGDAGAAVDPGKAAVEAGGSAAVSFAALIAR